MLFFFDHAVEIAAMTAANFFCIALLLLTFAQGSSSHEPAAASAVLTVMYAVSLMHGSGSGRKLSGRWAQSGHDSDLQSWPW